MSDDERIERARRFAEDMRFAADRQRTAEMEAVLAETPSTRDGVPTPSTCHPYYAKHRKMIEAWLDGSLGYGSRGWLVIPRVRRMMAADLFKPVEAMVPLEVDELERRKFRAPAPYLGEPYELRWYAGVDKRGRAVAGEVWYEFLFSRRAP